MLNTSDYRIAPGGEGPHAFTWKDKPHRLVYDLCREVERLQLLASGITGEEPPPFKGDYLYLGDERQTIIDQFHESTPGGYRVEDQHGVDYIVCRMAEYDTAERRAWRLSHPQTIG